MCSSGSVGQLDPNCECMLLDDDGKEVADGQPGELYVRGPNICMGYWRNPHATKESLSPDGWLKSGDVAVVKNGWFWIVDRKKVSLCSSNYNPQKNPTQPSPPRSLERVGLTRQHST